MKKLVRVVVLAFPLLISTECFSANNFNSVTIPKIEKWERSTTRTDEQPTPPCGHTIHWYNDPKGDGYHGILVYWHKGEHAKPFLIGKSWGFRITEDEGFDITTMRSALLLETGEWFVGDEEESVRFVHGHNHGKDSTTFRFKAANSTVSRTFICD